MGVRNTFGEKKVAMFDSTTGLAFGPVFDSEIELEDFLKWFNDVNHGLDPRAVDLEELVNQYDEWSAVEATP